MSDLTLILKVRWEPSAKFKVALMKCDIQHRAMQSRQNWEVTRYFAQNSTKEYNKVQRGALYSIHWCVERLQCMWCTQIYAPEDPKIALKMHSSPTCDTLCNQNLYFGQYALVCGKIVVHPNLWVGGSKNCPENATYDTLFNLNSTFGQTHLSL